MMVVDVVVRVDGRVDELMNRIGARSLRFI
jgi:hypothetical protein